MEIVIAPPLARTLSRTLVAAALTLLLAAATRQAAADLPQEVQVGTADIPDYEFDSGRDGSYCPTCNDGAGNCRLAYVDTDHKLWVAQVDHDTGAFIPPNGRGKLIDHDAATSMEIGNGAEWVMSQSGSQLVYTHWTAGQPITPTNPYIGVAQVGDGPWGAEALDNSQARVLPIGTLNAGDPYPAVHYQNSTETGGDGIAYWRLLKPGSPEIALPVMPTTRRWIPSSHNIIITAYATPDSAGLVYKQAYVYHAQSGQLEQLTFDPTDKELAWMWQAPEDPGAYAFFVLVNGKRLDVYRPIAKAGGGMTWTVAKSILGPSSAPYIGSPEPYTYNGKSWINFTVRSNPDIHDATSPAAVAMSGIAPSDKLRLLTSLDQPSRLRRDPEYFITSKGPYVYYNRLLLATPTHKAVPEGVFRVDTGLGPPLDSQTLASHDRP